MVSEQEPSRFLLLTYPRTASNLLVQILNVYSQPGVVPGEDDGGYFFLPVVEWISGMKLRELPLSLWTDSMKQELQTLYQTCFQALLDHIDSAEKQGLPVFVKEHGYFLAHPTAQNKLAHPFDNVQEEPTWTVQGPKNMCSETTATTRNTHPRLNITILPDDFLLTWLPTFLIRHPALAFPSIYRTTLRLHFENPSPDRAGTDFPKAPTMTLKWTRCLYDFYVLNRSRLRCSEEAGESWPIVLDADDVMTRPDILARYCGRLGLDPGRMRFAWNLPGKEESAHTDFLTRVMRTTLYESTGIIEGKTSDAIDIDREWESWVDEFGKPAADEILKLVQDAMPDYDFLRAHKLQ